MSTAELFTIGQIAALSKTPATTLRYYEKCGLLEEPTRISGQRRYDISVVGRLMVIRFCRVAGMGLDLIAEVLDDNSPNRKQTKKMAALQVARIDDEIDQLQMSRRMMVAASLCVCPTLERCDCGAMDDVIAELRERLSKEATTESKT